MKHLRKYNLFRESDVSYHNSRRIDTKVAEDIKLTCEEILLELKDEGFGIRIDTQFEKFKLNYIYICITNRKKFNYSYIQEYIERIQIYLKEYNIEFDGFASSIGPVKKPALNPETFESDGDMYISRFNFQGEKQMKEGRESMVTDWRKETIPSDIQSDLFDMLLELKDDGYDVSFQWCPPYEKNSRHYESGKYPYITIMKWDKRRQVVNYSDIKEYVERVIYYLDSNGFNSTISVIDNKVGEVSRLRILKFPSNEKDKINEISYEYRIEMINREIYGNVFESKNTLQDKLSILKELSLPLMDAGLYVNITATTPERFHEKGIYVEIIDNDKIFCKNYPEVDELDWLVSKPIMKEYYEELNYFGLQYKRDYILFGGGLSATLFFSDRQSKAIKL